MFKESEEKAKLLKQYEQEAALRKELEEKNAALLKEYAQKATLFQQCQEQMAMFSEGGEKQQAALRKELEEEKVESVKQCERWDASRKELKKEKADFLERFKKQRAVLSEQMAVLSKQCDEYEWRGVFLEDSGKRIKYHRDPGGPEWYQMRYDQKIEKSPDLFVRSPPLLLFIDFLIIFLAGCSFERKKGEGEVGWCLAAWWSP